MIIYWRISLSFRLNKYIDFRLGLLYERTINAHNVIKLSSFDIEGSSTIVKMIESEKSYIGVYNPNQRQFIEDAKRYKEKLDQLQAGGYYTYTEFKWIFFEENLIPSSEIIFISDNSSPTHLYIRPKDIEMDVDLLDKHDSFYKTTKSLLNLFQIMGIMPIQRSPPGKLLTNFDFRSFH